MSETVNDKTLSFNTTSQTPSVRFLASLSDGRTVIQGPGSGRDSSWIKLTEWLKANPSISITELRLQGPKGVDIKMPPNQKGYFFGNNRSALQGGGQSGYVGIGYYDGQRVNVVWHRQPSFDHSYAEERTVAKAGFFLIRNP